MDPPIRLKVIMVIIVIMAEEVPEPLCSLG
jgi:hypothetical protein